MADLTRTPQEIEAALAAGWEYEFGKLLPQGVDASSANAPWAMLARAPALALYGGWLDLQASRADFFVDSCRDELVAEHAARLGLYQAPAQPSGGYCDVPAGSTPGTTLPAGTTLGGGLYTITTTTVVGSGGTASVPVQAVTAGDGGDRDAGTVLALDAPIAGLAAQQLTVDDNGLTGGSDQETLDELRARAVAWRRRRPKNGCPGDYANWVREIYPRAIYVRELPLWSGLGRVGVAVAFKGLRAATTTEVARIQAYLAAKAPQDIRNLVTLAATITALPLTVAVSPDTTAVRAAVTAAYANFLTAEPGIGGIVEVSRLRQALSSASGEYAHKLSVPSGDQVIAGDTELFAPGSITWGVF